MRVSKPFGNLDFARVLVIGHDPRLQRSETIAEYCFFADYFFRSIPESKSEKAKYDLAAALFSYVGFITSYRFSSNEIYITNLCNRSLPHAPTSKTVLIPDIFAKEGIEDIQKIIEKTKLKLILALSQQVNYLLQKFSFYSSDSDYLKLSEPKTNIKDQGYYEPKGKSPFLRICGKEFKYKNISLFPVLHVKQFPLKGNIKKSYEPLYINCINRIKKL